MPDLVEALKRAAVALKSADLPFALAGGYAAYARGGGPSEHDVDFLLLEADLPRALDALEAAGFRTERPAEDWLAKAYDDQDVLVDLIFRCAGRPVTREELDRADDLDVASVHMPVASATDLLASKLLALTDHYCDLSTCLAPARALREQVEWDRLAADVSESPYARAFLVLAADLGIAPAETRDRVLAAPAGSGRPTSREGAA